jgi:hypothetical protein
MKSEEEEDYKPAAWFLGPKLENVDILKKLVEESFNVSAEFRQHHFPSDPQSITTKMKESRLYKAQIEHLTNEFRTLCREFKYSTNIASIRYQVLYKIIYIIKPVVISIKHSPVLKGHLVLS